MVELEIVNFAVRSFEIQIVHWIDDAWSKIRMREFLRLHYGYSWEMAATNKTKLDGEDAENEKV